MKKIIKLGEIVPPFYGVVSRLPHSGDLLCYPLGINLIVIIWIDIRVWLKWPKGN